MLDLLLPGSRRGTLAVLCIGAHCDDIEIGCGATLMRLTGERRLSVTWVVLSSTPARAAETRRAAPAFLRGARRHEVRFAAFQDGFLPGRWAEVKAHFETLKKLPRPDLIFTHEAKDLHQDHRIACELTWNTFRDHLILEYEIPKYDGDLGSPNVFVPLDEPLVDEKLRLLREHYSSQQGKHWFDDELFRGLMRLRGMESATRYAEAFTCRKLPLRLA
jgi:LmbE family N-acetylglucosaminyl deacetylase